MSANKFIWFYLQTVDGKKLSHPILAAPFWKTLNLSHRDLFPYQQRVLVHTRVFPPSPRFSLPPLLSALANCSFFSPTNTFCCRGGGAKNVEDEEDVGQDNLEPISAENIIGDGRRTRGKTIDFAAAAKKAEEDGEPIGEDDDDDDGDFEAHDDSNIRDDVDMMKD